MQLLRSFRPVTAVVAASFLFGAAPAGAVLHDHLKCYRAKDTASLSAILDLFPTEDPPFPIDARCKVKARSRQLCFPVAAIQFDATGPTLDVKGEELANPLICYTIKCPAVDLPDSVQLTDRFGTRTFTSLRTSTVCGPAVIGAPSPPTTLPPGSPRSCVDATVPNCDGTCGDFNFACAPDDGGTACICRSVDTFGGCPMIGGGPPACIGSCSGSQTCIEVGGECQCGVAY